MFVAILLLKQNTFEDIVEFRFGLINIKFKKKC